MYGADVRTASARRKLTCQNSQSDVFRKISSTKKHDFDKTSNQDIFIFLHTVVL
jgi:hypothetical protein